ncbi:MAG: translocation/assembly module TamB domain-containing protein [Candidatus Lernaella stagnicola]|nr:translocation/assembly module TamB domain-containing protein [Candidatus Lernaella stagnicola]
MNAAAKIAKLVLKIVGYTLAGVLGFVAVVLVTINFLLQSESLTGVILAQVLPGVEEAICADIEVESFTLRLVPFKLEIKGAKYTDPQGKFVYPFARFDRLLLTVKTAPLLSGQVVVSDLSLEGVEQYTRLEDGLVNLPLCPSKPEPEKPEEPKSDEPFKLALPIIIERLHIDGKVRFDMVPPPPAPTPENPNPEPGQPINVTVNGLTLDATADLRGGQGDVQAELRLADASFMIGTMYDKIDEIAIDAEANLQSWGARVPTLRIAMPDLQLSGDVTATDLLGELELAANLNLDVDLKKVNQLVLTKPEDMQLRGGLNLQTKAGLKLGKDKMTYSADGTIAMPQAHVNQLALRNFNAVFAADQDQARVKALHLETAGGRVDLQAKVGMGGSMPLSSNVKIAALNVGSALQQFGLRDLPVKAVLDADLSAGGRLSPLVVDTKGTIDIADVAYGDAVAVKSVNINLDATARGDSNQVRDLRITAEQIAAGGSIIPQATVQLVGNVGPKNNVIKMLQIKTAHTSVEVSGTANPAGALNLDALVKLDDLSEFQGFVGGKKLAGRGVLDAKVSGTAAKPDVEGALKFDHIVFDKTKIQSVSADLGFVHQRATVTNLLVEAGAATIKLDAAYDMSEKQPKIKAKLHMPETQIPELLKIAGLSDLDIKGATSLDVDIDGPLEEMNGAIVLKGTNLAAFGEKVERINLDAKLENGVVIIDDLSIVKNRGIRPVFHRGLWRPKSEKDLTEQERQPARIVLTGQVHPFDKTFDIRLRTHNLTEMASDTVRRDRILAMADVGLNADLVGTFDNPGAEIDLAITSGRFDHLDLGDSWLKIRIKEQRVNIEGELLANRRDIDLNRQDDTARGADRAFDLAAAGQGDDDDDPDFGAPPPPVEEKPPAKNLGAIKIRASLGLLDDMPLDARIDFDHLDYSNFLKSRELVKQQVKSGRKKSASLSEREEKQKVFGGMIHGSVVAAGALAAVQDGQFAEDGTALTKPNVAVDIRFDELSFQQNRFVLRNQDERGNIVPLHIQYENGRLTVPSFALGGEGVKLTLDSRQLRGETFLVLDGDIDMGIASNFTEAIAEATGHVILKAEIPVAFDIQKVLADVSMPGANFVIQNVPTAIENFNLQVTFRNGQATIEQLSADIGGGKLIGGGTYTLPVAQTAAVTTDAEKKAQPTAKLDLFVKLTDVKTGVDPYVELAIKKVDLIITNRSDGKLDISGDVELARAFATYEIDLISILKTLQTPKGGVSGSAIYEKKEESVFFNIGVRAERNVVFENNLAHLELRLDLLLTGSNIDTGMIGTVDILKGHALVWNNDYKVTNATVQFVDETRIVPAFDINAKTEVRGGEIIVFVNVAGTPDRFHVTLSSDPPKTERDIVALLTVGVSYEEFQESGSGLGSEQALAIAAQSLLGNRVSRYTGLDIGLDSSRGVPMLKASTELEKDLTASVFQALSDETLAAEMEYGFIRYLAVYTDWSNFAGEDDPPPSGGFGAGIRIKIEYR